MLKLLIFAPCEKVIVGDTDHLTSLISVLERVTVQVLKSPLAADALVPIKWDICTLWKRQQEVNTPRTYQQRVEIVRPDKTVAAHAEHNFVVSNEHNNFRNIAKLEKFPVGTTGIVQLRLSLREFTEDAEWQEQATYEIEVIHNVTAPEVTSDNES